MQTAFTTFVFLMISHTGNAGTSPTSRQMWDVNDTWLFIQALDKNIKEKVLISFENVFENAKLLYLAGRFWTF